MSAVITIIAGFKLLTKFDVTNRTQIDDLDDHKWVIGVFGDRVYIIRQLKQTCIGSAMGTELIHDWAEELEDYGDLAILNKHEAIKDVFIEGKADAYYELTAEDEMDKSVKTVAIPSHFVEIPVPSGSLYIPDKKIQCTFLKRVKDVDYFRWFPSNIIVADIEPPTAVGVFKPEFGFAHTMLKPDKTMAKTVGLQIAAKDNDLMVALSF